MASRSTRKPRGRFDSKGTGWPDGSASIGSRGPVASTRMAGQPELMALEDRFNSHLDGEHEIALEGDVLTLSREEHSTVLTCAPSLPGPVGEPG